MKLLSILLIPIAILFSSTSADGQDLKLQSLKNERTFNQGFTIVVGSAFTAALYKERGVSAAPLLITGAGGLGMMMLSSERERKLKELHGADLENMWFDPSMRASARNGSGWAIAGLFYGLGMFAVSQNHDDGGALIGGILTAGMMIPLVIRSTSKRR